jgi:hypothetical protein
VLLTEVKLSPTHFKYQAHAHSFNDFVKLIEKGAHSTFYT